jgi:hypothetical protein
MLKQWAPDRVGLRSEIRNFQGLFTCAPTGTMPDDTLPNTGRRKRRRKNEQSSNLSFENPDSTGFIRGLYGNVDATPYIYARAVSSRRWYDFK